MKNPTSTNETMLSGYLSVIGALSGGFRKIKYVLIESERYEKIKKSKLRKPEQRQYKKIFELCKKTNTQIKYGTKNDFESLKTSGGIAACASHRSFTPLSVLLKIEQPYFVYLDGIEDPYNFGYVLRSLHLSGADAVVLPERNFFTSSDIVAKSSAGLSETMTISTCSNLQEFCEQLKQNGVKVICTALQNSVSMYDADLQKPLFMVIGGERRGISKAVLELADSVVRIDYAATDKISLPAVSAASVLAFEIYRRNFTHR